MTNRQQLASNAFQIPYDAINILKTKRINGRVWNLTGDANANLRRSILESLKGKKLAKAKCGINELWDTLMALCNADFLKGECLAVQRDWLRVWILRYN